MLMDSRAIKTIFQRILFVFCASMIFFSAHAADVVFVLSKDAKPYQQFVESVRQSLDTSEAGRNITSRVVLIDEYIEAPDSYKLIIPVGTKATRSVVNTNTRQPVLSTLIPSTVYFDVVNNAQPNIRQKTSGVFIDHPFKRYVDFINQINPEWKRLGLLSSENNKQIKEEISGVENGKFKIYHEKVKKTDEVIQTLNRVLEDSNVFLTLADPVILNSSTAHGILLSAYHQKVPVISYLKSYVKAGALAALYSTPEDLGKQVGEYIIKAFDNGFNFVKQEQYPKYFSITVNNRVAHSLGLDNIDQEKIKSVLYKKEGIL